MNTERTEAPTRAGPDSSALDALTRERLGQQIREMYESVAAEPLDPRLAELLDALAEARDAAR